MNQCEKILGTKGDYRLINDGCATVPYLLTLEKKKVYPSGFIVWERVPNTPIYTDYREAIKALDATKSKTNKTDRKKKKETNKL